MDMRLYPEGGAELSLELQASLFCTNRPLIQCAAPGLQEAGSEASPRQGADLAMAKPSNMGPTFSDASRLDIFACASYNIAT